MTEKETRYKKCEKCGLRIRGKSVESHENGYHHNKRMETLSKKAKS